jgi:uncharacterized protein (TIGR00251 family)
MSAISQGDNGVLINIKVIPRASKNAVCGEMDDGALKIRLQAPPVEGKANKALVEFLSELLDVSKSSIVLLSGETGRHKRVFVKGIALEYAARCMDVVGK